LVDQDWYRRAAAHVHRTAANGRRASSLTGSYICIEDGRL
jgi:hypothetical protein